MKNNPLLSVIIPVYNVGEYIGECLLSVVKQTYNNLEVIIVNDGSTDNSLDVATEISQQYSNIHIYSTDNGGAAQARNFGLERISGDYLTFVDADDVLLDVNIYSRVMKCLEYDKSIDVVQYNVLHKWNSSEEYKCTYPYKIYSSKEEIAEGFLREYIHGSCCDKVFKKEVFNEVRFPSKLQCEDIAIIPYLIENINKLQTADIGYYGYRFREGSTSTSVPTFIKALAILSSYCSYFSYMYAFDSLKPLVLRLYTNIIWDYCSMVRKNYPECISQLLRQPFFMRITFNEWFSFSKQLSKGDRLKVFVVTVFGPKYILKFQKLFTR